MAYDFDMSGIPPKLREILEDMDSRISEGGGGGQADAVTPVSAEDASSAISAEYTQTEIQVIATLANANKAAINALITSLQTAGLMKNE